MFFDYIKEREGKESIVVENGFVVYSIGESSQNGNYIYIFDMFIKKEFRRDGITAELLIKRLYEVANKNSCKFVLATVDINTRTAPMALIFNLKNGFIPYNLDGYLIRLKKDL
jgi:hypothetical protein